MDYELRLKGNGRYRIVNENGYYWGHVNRGDIQAVYRLNERVRRMNDDTKGLRGLYKRLGY